MRKVEFIYRGLSNLFARVIYTKSQCMNWRCGGIVVTAVAVAVVVVVFFLLLFFLWLSMSSLMVLLLLPPCFVATVSLSGFPAALIGHGTNIYDYVFTP